MHPVASKSEVSSLDECIKFGKQKRGREVIITGLKYPKACHVYRSKDNEDGLDEENEEGD